MSKDLDPIETNEWLEAINSVIKEEGIERASFIMSKLAKKLNEEGAIPSYNLTTPFRNSIPAKDEASMPGDLFMERRIRSLIRWNALAIVLRANMNDDDLGGHISTFSSAATLYDVVSITSLKAQKASWKTLFIIKDILLLEYMLEVF